MKTKLHLFFILFLTTTHLSFSQWLQQGTDIDGEAAGDYAGYSVSLSGDGNIFAIGAYANDDGGNNSGHTRIYEFDGLNWNQRGNDIDGQANDDQSGYSVSLNQDGSVIAVGAINNSNGGVHIYQWDGLSWTQLGSDIVGEAGGDEFGYSVSINDNGTRVAIGAPHNDGSGSYAGHVRVFEFQGGNWVQLGSDIDGELAGDRSGSSVSLNSDGSIVAIGAPYNGGGVVGHVRIYQWDGASWNQMGNDINGEGNSDNFGRSVSLSADGNRVVIGGPTNSSSGYSAGHARVFEFQGGTWNQLGTDIDGEATNNHFGTSVSLSANGNIVAVSSDRGAGVGYVKVYQFNSLDWEQLDESIYGEAPNGYFGTSISLSDDGITVAAGGYLSDGNGLDSGHARVFSNPTPSVNSSSFPSVAVGKGSGQNTTTGNQNVFLGSYSGYNNTEGSNNTVVGYQSGFSTLTGSGNVFLGHRVGYNETESNRLYIDNSDTPDPLIWGNFTDGFEQLRINGTLNINNNYSLPLDDGAQNQVLATDGSGTLSWADPTSGSADNMGNHTAGQNIELGDYWLSGDGDDEGIYVDDEGNTIIGNVTVPELGGYSLYVQTGILTEKIKIAVNGTGEWSDHVFEKDYKLKPLREVEAYITKNKHLPGIPSAEDVVKEGIDVAQMDAKLLEKIEELVLYTIKQERSLKQQQKLIETQTEQLKQQKQTFKDQITQLLKRIETLENQ